MFVLAEPSPQTGLFLNIHSLNEEHVIIKKKKKHHMKVNEANRHLSVSEFSTGKSCLAAF